MKIHWPGPSFAWSDRGRDFRPLFLSSLRRFPMIAMHLLWRVQCISAYPGWNRHMPFTFRRMRPVGTSFVTFDWKLTKTHTWDSCLSHRRETDIRRPLEIFVSNQVSWQIFDLGNKEVKA